MAVFKCKMCGGNLEFTDGQSYGTCDSCGSTMTLPKANDERIVNLFNRATHYRQQNEFDKAMATYESILEEDNESAEAYWGRVLSKYGIEYVEDPKTHKRIPTCHRLQHESILSDLDYKSALKYALDYDAERIYKEEADKISEIQKNILSVANNEDPYDIFICYKETDNSGQRTIDSVLAQDIYSKLSDEGYKVFFSRITLEDKLGAEYEPYIFAALNSAKVMLVIGTDKDHFNAVWVKNEWSRFLSITRSDRDKIIIPCYRDMDAYDLPDELSIFQSQDMNKIGFIQDLVRGIKKVVSNNANPSNTITVNNTIDYKAQADSYLKRAFIFLEESKWQKADEALEKVLNISPENAMAYVGKLMIELKVTKEDDLGKIMENLSTYQDFQKALRFADEALRSKLEQYRKASEGLLKQELEKLKNEYKIESVKEREIRSTKKESSKLPIILLIAGFAFMLLPPIFIGEVLGLVDLAISDGVFSFFIIGVLLCIGSFISYCYLGKQPMEYEEKYRPQFSKTLKIKINMYDINAKLSGVVLNDRQKLFINTIKSAEEISVNGLPAKMGMRIKEIKSIVDKALSDENADINEVIK